VLDENPTVTDVELILATLAIASMWIINNSTLTVVHETTDEKKK
jgi:hypothetical protein